MTNPTTERSRPANLPFRTSLYRRQFVVGISTLVGAVLALGTHAVQAADTSWVIFAQQGGVERQEGGGKSYVVEAVIVVLFLGLALFAVCRSSRRV